MSNAAEQGALTVIAERHGRSDMLPFKSLGFCTEKVRCRIYTERELQAMLAEVRAALQRAAPAEAEVPAPSGGVQPLGYVERASIAKLREAQAPGYPWGYATPLAAVPFMEGMVPVYVAAPAEGATPSGPASDVLADFEAWWEKHGQFCRAGGGDYEKTFAFRAWEAATEQAAQPAEGATPSGPASGDVPEAMARYLRVCRSGGMPKSTSDQVERAVVEAARLGYFATSAPSEQAPGARTRFDELWDDYISATEGVSVRRMKEAQAAIREHVRNLEAQAPGATGEHVAWRFNAHQGTPFPPNWIYVDAIPEAGSSRFEYQPLYAAPSQEKPKGAQGGEAG